MTINCPTLIDRVKTDFYLGVHPTECVSLSAITSRDNGTHRQTKPCSWGSGRTAIKTQEIRIYLDHLDHWALTACFLPYCMVTEPLLNRTLMSISNVIT